jgi:hypothetical protein
MKQQQGGGGSGLLGVRFESQRFRLLSIVVGCFLISVTFLLSSRPDAGAFDTRTLPCDSPALFLWHCSGLLAVFSSCRYCEL